MNQKAERDRLERMINEGQGVLDSNVPGNGDIPEIIQAPSFEIDYDYMQTSKGLLIKLVTVLNGLDIDKSLDMQFEMLDGKEFIGQFDRLTKVGISG